MEREQSKNLPPVWLSVAVILISAFVIGFSVLKLGVDAHIPILIAAIISAVTGMLFLKKGWEDIQEGMLHGISLALLPIVILMMVGVVVGVWIQSGTVPALIYYGLNLLTPKIFLVASLLTCSIVSLATGSSWTTAGTVGIALMGIGSGLGVPAPLTAGVIVSGAYFGDKMSPLSDTTNLAPAVAGGELFDHIRAMCWTTIPTYIIVVIFYAIMGMKFQGQAVDAQTVETIRATLAQQFDINLITLIPPLIVILMAVKKAPAIPGLVLATLAGAIIAVVYQGASAADLINAAHYGYEASTGVEAVDKLLTRGGLDHMMWTISLIICALSFGGIMERCGYLESVLNAISKIINNVTGLVSTTIFASLFGNLFLGDQFLGIVVPGRMFKPAFDRLKLAPRMLSRTLEDCGTLTSPLIPWTACGGYMSAMLGVNAFAYAPYAVLNWLNPIMAIVLTFFGIGVFYRKD
ncbi:Na+/H+ antiporter NhaC [Thermovirga sp.]|uniref:Na+/H+ antiporter NhaC n=1 Tax=Thermovirga sp. TaxID=2699834 RepID=UPI003458C527|nr:Na+/H+ antiporter NhaC [Thermovirga sp.]